jgi:hypothetical protein
MLLQVHHRPRGHRQSLPRLEWVREPLVASQHHDSTQGRPPGGHLVRMDHLPLHVQNKRGCSNERRSVPAVWQPRCWRHQGRRSVVWLSDGRLTGDAGKEYVRHALQLRDMVIHIALQLCFLFASVPDINVSFLSCTFCSTYIYMLYAASLTVCVALQTLEHKQIQHLSALLCLCHHGNGPTTFGHNSHLQQIHPTQQVFGLPLLSFLSASWCFLHTPEIFESVCWLVLPYACVYFFFHVVLCGLYFRQFDSGSCICRCSTSCPTCSSPSISAYGAPASVPVLLWGSTSRCAFRLSIVCVCPCSRTRYM